MLLFSRFGATPKMIGAAAVGYFMGKVSYMDTCREKFLMQIPNSNISMAIRKARGEVVEVCTTQISSTQLSHLLNF
jgi:hypothetical protein